MSVLSKNDKQRIADVIERVEGTTAGEIVVGTVKRCRTYGGPRMAAAFAVSLGLTAIAGFGFPQLTITELLLGQWVVACVAWLMFGGGWFVRLTASRKEREQNARARAMQMFAERGIHNTRDHSGLLIMLAFAEHDVVILGDSGMHKYVGDEGWDAHVRTIIEGIRSGRPADAIVSVIESLGAQLAEHFPLREGDTNELSNAVVEEP